MRTIRFFCVFFIFSFVSCFFCNRQSGLPVFWPGNGTCFNEISWELPLADSSSVPGQNEAGVWLLPEPPPDAVFLKGSSCHRSSQSREIPPEFRDAMQVVEHETGPVSREYYRFEKGNVLLLGYEIRNSAPGLTVYDPPLTLIPSLTSDSITVRQSESIPFDSRPGGETGPKKNKTRLKFLQKRAGTVLVDSVIVPARLCEITLATDREVGFGSANFIVPDAVMMRSRLLVAKGIGPILEWGIRSRPASKHRSRTSPSMDSTFPEAREFYMEVTRHDRADRIGDSL